MYSMLLNCFCNSKRKVNEWGEEGYARYGIDFFDPGASENPGDVQDMSDFAQIMMQAEEAMQTTTIEEDLTE